VLGHLYRYPHPLDATRFIYCGQGPKRDKAHRPARSAFGRRFKKKFPDVELPQPIRKEVEVIDGIHLNHLETAWMILYQTLRVLHGGENVLLPGSKDYESLGRIVAAIPGHMAKAGRLGGRAHVKSGQLAGISAEGGRISGRKNAESGHLDRIRTKESSRKGGLIGGHIGGRATNATTNGRKGNGGRIGGRKNVESGHLASIRTKESCSKGGHIQPREAKVAGGRKCNELYGNLGTPEGSRKGAHITNCRRWNINRGKPCTCGKHITQV
jgi:hypothetical protein